MIGRRVVTALIAFVAHASVALGELSGQSAALSREEAAILRRAVLESRDMKGARDPLAVVDAWLSAEPGLATPMLDALRVRLRSDAIVRRSILELAGQRTLLQAETRGNFVSWWDPRQTDAHGNPSTGLSSTDTEALGEFLLSLARELGIPPPSGIPHVLDLQADGARVRGPRFLRWGIVTPDAVDRVAVAKLLLLEVGDAAFVVDPLSALRGCEDRACRRELLGRARAVVIRSGYVPIVDGLQSAALAGVEDPAFASALLVVDRLDRLHPARTFTALLAALETANGPSELRSAFYRATGEAPGRLDKLVQVELSEWAAAHARAAAETQGFDSPARRGPPSRSW